MSLRRGVVIIVFMFISLFKGLWIGIQRNSMDWRKDGGLFERVRWVVAEMIRV